MRIMKVFSAPRVARILLSQKEIRNLDKETVSNLEKAVQKRPGTPGVRKKYGVPSCVYVSDYYFDVR